MESTFYELRTGKEGGGFLVANVEIPESDVRSDNDVDQLVFKIAGDQIAQKGGGAAVSKIRILLPPKDGRPTNAITHPDHPGIYVWFP